MVGAVTDPTEGRIAAALDAGDRAGAATLALRAYGPPILGYLHAIVRDDGDAREAYSMFSEDLWDGIGGFRRECSMKTWAYKLAWNAACRLRSSPYRRRGRRLRTSELAALAEEVRSSFSTRREAERADALRRLRERLSPEEQSLLTLRIDRGLSWNEVAIVMSAGGESLAAAALRQRYQRLKLRMHALARAAGLEVEPPGARRR
jgi:RNA polymerase sigma-70 factor (ECF subfamily)